MIKHGVPLARIYWRMRMATIQKRADELKPGDVWKQNEAAFVVVGVVAENGDKVDVPYVQFGKSTVIAQRFYAEATFDVESPDLTPAQLHAEKLVDALSAVASTNQPAYLEMVRDLLDKIKPPEPPTLEEALAALEAITSSENDEAEYAAQLHANKLLDRARKSGVFKP